MPNFSAALTCIVVNTFFNKRCKIILYTTLNILSEQVALISAKRLLIVAVFQFITRIETFSADEET